MNASDPFAPQPGGGPDGGWSGSGAAVVAPPPPVRRTGRGRAVWVEVAVVAMTALVIAAAGAPLAVAWWLIAPKVPIVVSSVGPVYVNYETERFMSADGWFVTLGAGAGVLVAIVCWLAVRYHRGPAMLAALVGGSVGAAVLASWLGGQIGRLDYDYLLRHAPAGAIFYHPVTLGARGGLLVQAALAVFAYTLIAGCSRFPLLTKLRPTPTRQPNPPTPTAQPIPTAQPWPPTQPPQQGQPNQQSQPNQQGQQGQPESQQPTATASFPVPSAGQPAPDHQQNWSQAGPDREQGRSQASPDRQQGWSQASQDQRQGWAPPAPDYQQGWDQPTQAQPARPAGADHTGPFQPFGLPNQSQARPDQGRPDQARSDQQGPSPVPPPSQQPYDPFAPPSPAGPTDWPR